LQQDFATVTPILTSAPQRTTTLPNTNTSRSRPGSAPARRGAAPSKTTNHGTTFSFNAAKQKLDKHQIASIDALIDGLYLTPKMYTAELRKSEELIKRAQYQILVTPTEIEKTNKEDVKISSRDVSPATPNSSRPGSAMGSPVSTRRRSNSKKKNETPLTPTIVIRLTVWERLKQGSIKRAHHINELQTREEPIPPQYLDESDMVNIFHEFIQREIVNNKNRKHNPFLNMHTLVKLYMKKKYKDDEAKKIKDHIKFTGLIRNRLHLTRDQVEAVMRNAKPGSFELETKNSPSSKQARAKAVHQEQEKESRRKKKDQVYETKVNKIMSNLHASHVFNIQLQQIEREIDNPSESPTYRRRVSFQQKNFQLSAASLFSENESLPQTQEISLGEKRESIQNSSFTFGEEVPSPKRPQSASKSKEPARNYRSIRTNRRPAVYTEESPTKEKAPTQPFVLSRTLTEAKLKLFVPYTPNRVRNSNESIVRRHNASWTHEQFTNMENPHDISDYKPQTMVMNYYRRKMEQNMKKMRERDTPDIEPDVDENANPHRGNNLVLEFQKMVLNDHHRPTVSSTEDGEGKKNSPKPRGTNSSNPLLTPRIKMRRKPALDTNMSKKKRKGLPD
jgi:hypothetical protein